MQFKFSFHLAVLAVLTAIGDCSALIPRAAGYCNTKSTKTILKQSGDYVNIYWVDVPSYSGGGSITTNCLMNSGAGGTGVKSLQGTLNYCHGESLDVDGDYDAKTKAAVKRVQKKYKISQDGIYGPTTSATITWYGAPINVNTPSCVKISVST